MKICEVCKREFTYKEIFENQKKFDYLKCPKCFQEYTLTKISKLISAFIYVLPIFFVSILIKLLGWYTIIFYMAWYFIVLGIMPFFYRYKKSNKN